MGIIYVCRNKVNGKCYVGQTIWTLKYRKESHELDALHGGSFIFQRALLKYGFESFEWEVLTEADDEHMNRLEIHYIKELNSKTPHGYNMTDGGESTKGLIWSEESRRTLSELAKKRVKTQAILEGIERSRIARTGMKQTQESVEKRRLSCIETWKKKKALGLPLSTPLSEESRKKLSKSLTGKKRTPETLIKMSEAQKRRPPVSEESRKKMSESAKNRKRRT